MADSVRAAACGTSSAHHPPHDSARGGNSDYASGELEMTTELVERAKQCLAKVNPNSTWAVNGCTEMYNVIPELIVMIERLGAAQAASAGGHDRQALLAEVLEEHRPYGLDCKCRRPINSDRDWAMHAATAADKGVRRGIALAEEEVDPE